jgi:hypothetical protein
MKESPEGRKAELSLSEMPSIEWLRSYCRTAREQKKRRRLRLSVQLLESLREVRKTATERPSESSASRPTVSVVEEKRSPYERADSNGDVCRAYFERAQQSVESLVAVRRQWDRFVVPEGLAGGSLIPPHFVCPASPSSTEWGRCVVRENSSSDAL